MDISELRREYTAKGVRRADLHRDGVEQFELWFQQACAANIPEPNAMVLATVTREAQPTQRTVLLKYFDAGGFVFFTNLESHKAQQIASNPRVSLLFLWADLGRQVVISGHAVKLAAGESLRYFASRPRGSQLGAWVSRQSSVIGSRQLLEVKFAEMKRKFGEGKIPLPSFWGGYRVTPDSLEFWQGRANRLHDRFLYTLEEDRSWRIARLAP